VQPQKERCHDHCKSVVEGAQGASTTRYHTPFIHYRPDKLFAGILQTGKKNSSNKVELITQAAEPSHGFTLA